MKLHPQVIRKILTVAAALAVVIMLWHTTGLHELFLQFLAYLEKIARQSGPAGVIAFLVLAIMASASGPFTVVPLVPAAVQVWGILATGALMMFAGLVGGGLTYVIGRFAGERVLHVFISPSQIQRWKEHIPEDSALIMAVVIKFSLPGEVGYAFGAIRFGLGRYLVATFLSYIPIIAAILWGSDAFVHGQLAPVIISIVAMSTLTIVAGVYLHQRRDEAKRRRFVNFFKKIFRKKM